MTNKTKQKLKKMNFLGQRRIDPTKVKHEKLIENSYENIYTDSRRSLRSQYS